MKGYESTLENLSRAFAKERLVFLDESGIEDNACPTHGWSLKGTRCYGKKAYQHQYRVSMIAGLSDRTLIAPFLFKGYCNKEVFEAYVEQVLIKELKSGQIIIMDNISFHKTPKVKRLIESVGCELRFQPPYSPDLNPIENYWFKIKNHIRKMASSFPDILAAAAASLSIPF